jgi:CMP-N-acetylneuraminic acid synthetase
MIPARLGSTRIPKKNIRYLDDKPLIQYPIDLVRESGLFNADEIFINACEPEFAAVAEQFGVNYHKRPHEYSTDTATNREFTYDFLKSNACDFVVMLNTTSPLLRVDTITSFINFVKKDEYDGVFSVVAYRSESFYRDKPLNFDITKKVNSQHLEPVSKIVWALTAWRREPFLRRYENNIEPIFCEGEKISTFEIPEDECCDLDTPEDWNIAEGMIQARKLNASARFMNI